MQLSSSGCYVLQQACSDAVSRAPQRQLVREMLPENNQRDSSAGDERTANEDDAYAFSIVNHGHCLKYSQFLVWMFELGIECGQLESELQGALYSGKN